MLLYDEAYFFEYLINEKNYKVFNKFKACGLVKNIPVSYIKNNLKYLQDVLSACVQGFILDNEQLNFQYSFENMENKKYHLEIENMNTEYAIERNNLEYKQKIYERKTRVLYSFIDAYRRNRKFISNELYDDFCFLQSIESFIFSISELIDSEVRWLENEDGNFNFNRIISNFYGYFGNFIEKTNDIIKGQEYFNNVYGFSLDVSEIPKKYYIDNYFNLIESHLLFNASFELSLNENAVIKMPYYFNHNVRPIDINNPGRQNRGDSYLQIYRLLIEEMNFPELNNVDDFLKFRENKHLKEFKKLLFEWNASILNDEYSSLDKIKNYLKKANEKFNYLDKIKRTPIDFYVAIPLAIVDLLFKTPLSLIPLAITSYFKIDELITRQKYKGLIWK